MTIFFRVSPDNNCLYNAASMFVVGNESIANILRLLTSIGLFCHSEYYSLQLDKIWDSLGKSHFTTKLSMLKTVLHFTSADNMVDCNDTKAAFRSEAELNCNTNEWSSLVCIMALSTVINSIYSPKLNTRLYQLFTRIFKSRSEDASSKTLTLLWSTTENVATYTRPNHFVLCMDIKNMNVNSSLSEKKRKKANIQTQISFNPKQNIQSHSNDINNSNDGTTAPKKVRVETNVESLTASTQIFNMNNYFITEQNHNLPGTSKDPTNVTKSVAQVKFSQENNPLKAETSVILMT